MNSPARRKAAAAHESKLQGEGWRKVTFRADPETLAALDSLVAAHGTLQAAIRAAIMGARTQVSQRGKSD